MIPDLVISSLTDSGICKSVIFTEMRHLLNQTANSTVAFKTLRYPKHSSSWVTFFYERVILSDGERYFFHKRLSRHG